MSEPLAAFSPLMRDWFAARFEQATAAQAMAWPAIASGAHVLISSPTGSGKTLSAFLWALDRLHSGAWLPGAVRVVYLSPLRALGNDIEKNLRTPLAGLADAARATGITIPEIKVGVRTGDTSAAERARMLRRPPEILITTPESLAIMLTARRSRELFRGVRTVILDEVHALAGDRRGTLTSVSLERIVELAGEFQRIALSATVQPLALAAAFVGGYQRSGEQWSARPVQTISAPPTRPLQIEIRATTPDEGGRQERGADSVWENMAPQLVDLIKKNRSTLIFVNSRRLAERITRYINEAAGQNLALCHHGSLSRELRLAAEERLKQGLLPAIVATSSLELGIDIGAVEQVVLIQSPKSVGSLLQRVGRSGRQLHIPSRGALFPGHDLDYLDAAVCVGAALERNVEPIRPLKAPLDALAQILVSLACTGEQSIDAVYELLRGSYSYHSLGRREYELCLEMLAGRYEETRIRELKPRLAIDRQRRSFRARDGAERVLYMAGGMIPDRGYFTLRNAESNTKLGELDEEFVWERAIGDAFSFGRRAWRVVSINHNEVLVLPASGQPALTPFWRADDQDQSFATASHSLRFLEEADGKLEDPGFRQELIEWRRMEAAAADRLLDLLRAQKRASGRSLPHRRHVLVEHVQNPIEPGGMSQTIVHTFWGGKVNRPFALALRAALRREHGIEVAVLHDDRCIALAMPGGEIDLNLARLVSAEQLLDLLKESLENSGFFGARFREAAGRALLLPPRGFGQRSPLWFSRLRAGRLQSAVRGFGDFPALIESWRTCLQDEFDLEQLGALLGELASGQIQVSHCVSQQPSPFARSVVWRETNYFMYQDDTPRREERAALDEHWIERILARPAPIDSELVAELELRLLRLRPGEAPAPGLELEEFVRDLVATSDAEWAQIAAAVAAAHRATPAPGDSGVSRIMRLEWNASCSLVVHRDRIDALQRLVAGRAAPEEEAALLGEWFRARGPRSLTQLNQIFTVATDRLAAAIHRLEKGGKLLRFESASGEELLCDRENFQQLLRMRQRRRRQELPGLDAADWPAFVLALHRLPPPSGSAGLEASLERLFGYPAPAAIWEEWLFPQRLPDYQPAMLDAVLALHNPIWFGCANQELSFAFLEDLELFLDPAEEDEELEKIFGDASARLDLSALQQRSGQSAADLSARLWDWTWAGRISAEGFGAIRRGIETRFRTPTSSADAWNSAGAGASGRAGQRRRNFHSRWGAARSVAQLWRRLPAVAEETDPWRSQELEEARVRVLLARYGILFRELCDREAAPLRWSRLAPLLRRMEMAGEVVGGEFIRGLGAIQYASAEALRLLGEGGWRTKGDFLLHAFDPASPCGLNPGGAFADLPPRRRDCWIAFCGGRPALGVQSGGARLQFYGKPDDAASARAVELLPQVLHRRVRAPGRLRVREINGQAALESDFVSVFQQSGFRRDYTSLSLHR